MVAAFYKKSVPFMCMASLLVERRAPIVLLSFGMLHIVGESGARVPIHEQVLEWPEELVARVIQTASPRSACAYRGAAGSQAASTLTPGERAFEADRGSSREICEMPRTAGRG